MHTTSTPHDPESDMIHWTEAGEPHTARWRSERAEPPPKRVMVADDRLTADAAFRLVNEGTALLWRGDYQNARQLLDALARRVDRKSHPRDKQPPVIPAEAFNRQRQIQGRRARLLGMVLLSFEADHRLALRRAPDVRSACEECLGVADQPYVTSLRALLGMIGAHEWRKKGIEISALGGRIHPHFGVFAPIRSEYVELVAQAPLPATRLAFDIGTGTGVLAAVLARRGVTRVVATDQDERALACARDNIARLGMGEIIEVLQADLFPPGRAPLVVCNPPWIPARPSAPIEHGIYDFESRMLRAFLAGLPAHLDTPGEGWLILSDLAEHLGLRSRDQLLGWIADAGLQVLARTDVRPRHPRAVDASDPLHRARAAEVTTLWRLTMRE